MTGSMTIDPASARVRSRSVVHAAMLALAGALSAIVLVYTAGGQIYDTNFQTLWEATELLGGDQPYRDFFEWGLPLQAVASAAAQVLSGHRLIGEFLVQWMFIIAAMVISLHLAIALSRSMAASLVTMSLAVLLLAATPTYHYPKLFFYPLALWLSWRYMERPDARRGAALGLTTALAFLFRHDHGVYVAVLSVVTFVLARLVVPSSRMLRSIIVDLAAYTAPAAVVLLPWLIVVQINEGVFEYVRARTYLYEDWSARESPYLALATMNPLRTLMGERSLPPRPGVVAFTWSPGVDPAARMELEQRYHLRRLHDSPDESGRWRYEVPNIYAADLWQLRGELENADSAEGLEWDRLERLQAPPFVPTREAAQLWFYQVALLMPILLLASAGLAAVRAHSRGERLPMDCCRMVAAAAFLFAIEASVLREASYVMALIPLIAALSARFLAGWTATTRTAFPRLGPLLTVTRIGIAAVFVLVTALSTFASTRSTGIFDPPALTAPVPVLRVLMAAPPIDGYQPSAAARLYDRQAWESGAVDRGRLLIRYMHDCTRPDDRILVTGSTPYHVNYYANRRVAGGHVFWHVGWRSDPAREQTLLALLQSQSVPFAFSTHDPVFADLKRYPRIYEYFRQHYEELDGTRGLLLVDTRRQPTSRFGRLGFPCFN